LLLSAQAEDLILVEGDIKTGYPDKSFSLIDRGAELYFYALIAGGAHILPVWIKAA
jgi:hypothetical protein